MNAITENEMRIVLAILKSPEWDYNATSLAKELEISPMGTLKIARRLEKEGVIVFRNLGKANFLRLSTSEYALQYAAFIFNREAEHAATYIKMWIEEARKIKSASAAILFGSVLSKQKAAKDIDLFIVVSNDNFSKVKKEIDAINLANMKKLHPVFQTEKDLKSNILKRDDVVLSAIKGIVAFGGEKIAHLLSQSHLSSP